MKKIVSLILAEALTRDYVDVVSCVITVQNDLSRIVWNALEDILNREKARGTKFDHGDLQAYLFEYLNT